jgi:hypothetical protein
MTAKERIEAIHQTQSREFAAVMEILEDVSRDEHLRAVDAGLNSEARAHACGRSACVLDIIAQLRSLHEHGRE